MTTFAIIRFVHLVAAATWVGGIIVLAPIVVALRRAGAGDEQIRAGARAFARVSWVAMAVAVATGIGQALILQLPASDERLDVKILAVAAAIGAAAVHQRFAAASPRVRRALEALVLATTLLVVAAAVRLHLRM